jgi:type II secretion system protein F
MTTFAYTAVEPSGKRKTGFVDASTREAAMAAIAAEGRFVLEIKEQAARQGTTTKGAEPKKKGKVTKSELALFTRRLADLSGAGLPLDRVLQVIAEQSESAALSEVAEQILQEVRGGMPVSQAMAKFPKLFPDMYAQTLRAGEASGQFPEVAARLADFQEKEVARRSQVISALIYPGVLTLTAVFVIIFLLTFVVPKLSGVFNDLGSDLPMTTQILLATTGFITKNWILIICTLVGGFILFRAWSATEAGGLAKDRILLTMPIVGPVVRKATVSRFARVLGTLVFGGVPILEALQLSGLAAGNRVFRVSADQVEAEVREGRSIAEAMRDAGSFPPVLTHMVAIGEETGDLPKMLGRVSDSMDFEVDNGLRRLTSLVEPIIVLGMGTFVGFVVLSVLLPIFQAQNLVK